MLALERVRWWSTQVLFVSVAYFGAAATAGIAELWFEPSPTAAAKATNATTPVAGPATGFGLANLGNLQFLLSTNANTAAPTVTNGTAVAMRYPARPGSPHTAAPVKARLVPPKLVGTLAGGSHHLAVLAMGNDTRVVGEGEEFNDYTVLAVTSYEARVKDPDGQTYNITMGLANVDDKPSAPPAPPVAAATPTASPTPDSGPLTKRELRQLLDHVQDHPMNVHSIKRNDEVVGYMVNYNSSEGNPFARIGVLNGDILLTFQDRPLKSPEDLQWAYSELRNADNLSFSIERGGKVMPITVPVTE